MAGGGTTNTYPEWLKRLAGDVGQAFTLPDADINFLAQVQGMIVDTFRKPIDNMQQAGTTAVQSGPQDAMGSPMGMPSPMDQMQQGSQIMGAGGRGLNMGAGPQQMPNPDELRRMLATQGMG